MRRRSRAGGKSPNAQAPKAAARKSHIAPKPVRPRTSSATREETEVARLTRERDEALEREKATGEVLRVISSSPGQLEPVFRAVLEDAVRILEAKFGVLFLYEGDLVRPVAGVGLPPKLRKFQVQRGAFVPPLGLPLARLIQTKKVVQMLDDPERLSPATKLGGARSHLAVPMLMEGKVVGAIYIYWQEVKPFTDRQIELVSNFAAQAVIAIENARLFEAEQQRSRELRESLQQQTATADVLRVISSSPGELEPVFQAILANPTRICTAKFGNLWLPEGNNFRIAATHGAPPAYVEYLKREPVVTPEPESAMARVASRREVVQIEDISSNPRHEHARRHDQSCEGPQSGWGANDQKR